MEMRRKRPWSREEDQNLKNYVNTHQIDWQSWDTVARYLGTGRSGNSCRLRWLNYLSPSVNRGNITDEEMILILELHSKLGNRWSEIAERLPGRTDNHIKNLWNTRVKKEAKQRNLDVGSDEFRRTMIACLKMRIAVNHPTTTIAAIAGGTSAALVTSATSPNTVSNPNSTELELGVASYSPGSTIDPDPNIGAASNFDPIVCYPNTGVLGPFHEFGNPSYDPIDSIIGVASFSGPTVCYPNIGTVADGYNDFFPSQEFENPNYTMGTLMASSLINSNICHPNHNIVAAASFSGPTDVCYGTSIGIADDSFHEFRTIHDILGAHDTAAGYTMGTLMASSLVNSIIDHPNPNIVAAASFSGPTDVCYGNNIGIADILGGSSGGTTIGYNFGPTGYSVGYPASFFGPTVQYPNIGNGFLDFFTSQNFGNPSYVLSVYDGAIVGGNAITSINSTISHPDLGGGPIARYPSIVVNCSQEVLPSEFGNPSYVSSCIHESDTTGTFVVSSSVGPFIDHPNIGDLDVIAEIR